MKLEIARGLFLVTALSVVSLAAAAWQEASPQVITLNEQLGYCPLPPQERTAEIVRPDHDLLLLMFSLSQGAGVQG
ncbi:hypothetical protein [Pseudomonas sp. EA_35y_Pfl2_R5]|uniref:hypothetical protein n=1 Tax=Pseudomonas sp. EA_35y_Pfl2_R5 TaxID=3088690 RepID=UPI0030DD2B8E